MACTGCDARMEWAKRKAKLLSQTIAAMVKQKPAGPDSVASQRAEQVAHLPAGPKTHGSPDGEK